MIRATRQPSRLAARAARLALACTLALPASSHAADERVPADPWQIIHIAREFGEAEVGRDSMKDPLIEAKVDGLDYRITFYGCYLGRECDTILFEARLSRKEWEENPPRGRVFDRWNRSKLFGRAWRDDDNRAVLDYPLTMVGGLSHENLRDAFARWCLALEEYSDHLGF